MDFWTDIAFAVLFRILKNKKLAQQMEPAFMKLHGLIEQMFPKLKPDSDDTQGTLPQ